MDKADIANDYAQLDIDRALAARKRYQGKSATECIDCDEPIPDRRRHAIPGCQRCADCQDIEERRSH